MLKYEYSLFYLGKPVKTPIGDIHFKTLADYEETSKHLSVLQQTNKIYIIKLLMKTGNAKIVEIVRDEPFIDTMMILGETPIYTQYVESLLYFFGVNLIDKENILVWSDEELYEYLELIYHMNAVGFPKRLTGNPEIDRFIEYEQRMSQSKNKDITFESILSSVAMWMGKTIDELMTMTNYQMYVNFYRIAQFKSYDVTTLFRTIDSKIKTIEWNAHVDILGSINKKEKTLEQTNEEGSALFT